MTSERSNNSNSVPTTNKIGDGAVRQQGPDHIALPCLILAGGLGSRLRPVVDDRPKCLAPVLGRPFLAFQLEAIAAAGVRKVVLCTGHLATQVEDAFGTEFAGLELVYSKEPTPLGTGGAARLGIEKGRDSTHWIVLNGDSYLECDLRRCQQSFFNTQFAAAMTLVEMPDTARYGRVEVSTADTSTAASRRVLRFAEKSAGGRGWINAGVYFLSHSTIETLPLGISCSLEKDLFPRLAAAGQLAGITCLGDFIDIGTPESLKEAQRFFANQNRAETMHRGSDSISLKNRQEPRGS